MTTVQQIPNMAGKAMTVRGPIDPTNLGVTLPHEHLLADLRMYFQPSFYTPATDIGIRDNKLALNNLHLARQGKPIADVAAYTDEKLATVEGIYFRDAGGNTIVDLGNNGMRRDPLGLRRISYATGLNVVMGTGWYIKPVHPEDMDQRTVEDLTDEIIRDVTVGVGDTGIRSGIIGEVGVNGAPITSNEIKSIKAAARASKATGAPISLHRAGFGRDEKLQTLHIISEEGADLTRTVLGHSDRTALEFDLLTDLLELGPYVEFDFLGKLDVPLMHRPATPTTINLGWSLGAVVADAILDLIEAGYEDRILLSHDCFTKTNFKSYGGTGWAFVLEKFLPHLKTMGVTEEQINKFVVENPKRVLTFVEPR